MTRIDLFMKVDEHGQFHGYDAERMPEVCRHHFRWKFVKVTIEGWEMTENAMKGWYFGGIRPAILQAMRDAGNPVHPKDQRDLAWIHDQMKRAFLPPIFDEHGNPMLNDKGETMHTTKGLGLGGWYRFIDDVLKYAWDFWQLDLKPEKRKNRRT